MSELAMPERRGIGTTFKRPTSTLFNIPDNTTFILHGDYVSDRHASFNGPGALGTTTSLSNVDLPRIPFGGPSIVIAKTGSAAQSNLKVELAISCYSTDIALMRLAVSVTGIADVDVSGFFFNNGNVHHGVPAGIKEIPGVAAGSITVTARWRRISGIGTLSMNTDDWVSLWVEEVPV